MLAARPQNLYVLHQQPAKHLEKMQKRRNAYGCAEKITAKTRKHMHPSSRDAQR